MMFFTIERSALNKVFDTSGRWWLTEEQGSRVLRLAIGAHDALTTDLDIGHTRNDLSLWFSLDPDGGFWVIFRKRES